MPDQSLGQMFFDRAKQHVDVAAFKIRHGNGFLDVRYSAASGRVSAIASGLLTVPGSLPRRASVAIVGPTSAEWILCDIAVMSLDAISVPVYPNLLAGEIGYIATDANVEIVIVQNKAQLDRVRTIKDGFTFLDKQYPATKLRHYVVIDEAGVDESDDVECLADLEKRGREQLEATAGERADRLATTKRESVATYMYTSGTTGAPKGVVQTHDNWLSILEVSAELAMFEASTREHGAFLFLPLAHSFGRLIEFSGIYHVGPLIISSIDTIPEDLAKTRPGLLPAAPRVYEKIYARITGAVAQAPARRQKLFWWAVGVGRASIPYLNKGKPMPLLLRLQHRLADKLVLSKIRAKLGLDRVKSMITGSAPLAPVVHEFFVGCGMPLYEGYGLTETCPALTANRPSKWKIGTVGLPLKNVTIKIASDGEILAKGPNVVSGYLNRPEVNQESFVDGWFHTGDIGEFDADGFLRITDRKKDLLKTSGGKYIAPQKIEGLLKSKPMIIEAVVIGDNRKYCTALLVLDDESWKAWAEKRGKKGLDPKDPELLAQLQQSVNEVNRDLASFESIKYFRVVDIMFTVESGLLTASFKVKRKEVNKRFQALIDEMYAEGQAAREAA